MHPSPSAPVSSRPSSVRFSMSSSYRMRHRAGPRRRARAAGGAPRPRVLRSRERGEAMPKPPPDVMPEIARGDLSEDLLEAYLAGPDLAIDTETMGLLTPRDRLCVVQLCDRRGRAGL